MATLAGTHLSKDNNDPVEEGGTMTECIVGLDNNSKGRQVRNDESAQSFG